MIERDGKRQRDQGTQTGDRNSRQIILKDHEVKIQAQNRGVCSNWQFTIRIIFGIIN